MKFKIKENIENPEQLENLFRSDKRNFENAFFEVYPEIADHKIASFWKSRLEYEKGGEFRGKITKSDLLFLVIACLAAGFLIKIPHWFEMDLNEDSFYRKNAGMIVFFGLSLYLFLTKKLVKTWHLILTFSVFLFSAIYINYLPSDMESHSVILAFIHLPLMLWCLYGLVYIDFDLSDKTKRIEYIRYNGDLAILGAIILISGGILTALTLGLFSAIDLNIEELYFDYIVLVGLVSAPVVATFIIRKYPQITNKIAPVIANIFSPLVLITLVVYLVSILVTGKDPYNDRDFLIVFNLMLLGVMGIVVFAISETTSNKKRGMAEWTLFALAIIALIIDLVALSAILYRLGEYGFTPNRTAVLGSNLLIFGNLLLISIDLFRVSFRNEGIEKLEYTIARYLPLYTIWTVFVVFGLPWIFGLK